MIYSVSLTYVSVFVPIPLCFDCSNFVVLSEARERDTSSFVTFSQIALAIMGLLWFHISFRIICSSSSEKCGAYFDRDCIKSIDCLWKYGHLKNINSSRTQEIYSFLCIIFSFYHQYFMVFTA